MRLKIYARIKTLLSKIIVSKKNKAFQKKKEITKERKKKWKKKILRERQ